MNNFFPLNVLYTQVCGRKILPLNAKHNEAGNLFLGDQQSGKSSASLIFNGLWHR